MLTAKEQYEFNQMQEKWADSSSGKTSGLHPEVSGSNPDLSTKQPEYISEYCKTCQCKRAFTKYYSDRYRCSLCGSLAQSVEPHPFKMNDGGSSPPAPTTLSENELAQIIHAYEDTFKHMWKKAGEVVATQCVKDAMKDVEEIRAQYPGLSHKELFDLYIDRLKAHIESARRHALNFCTKD